MKRRVALVTGAGGGIGSAIARELAEEGYAIAVNDIDAGACDATVRAIDGAGATARGWVCDVGDPAAVARMVDEVEATFGAIEVLVNNAGNPGRFSLLVDMSEETWHRTLRVHMTAPFLLMRACARRMLQRGVGRIVNIASLAGIHGTVGSGEYGAAKAGLINLTATAAKELAPFGITVNAVAPGMVATPANLALQGKGSGFIDAAIDGIPCGRLVAPAEIARTVRYLVGAGAVNGVMLPIDGGAHHTMPIDAYMLRSLVARSEVMKEVGP